MSDKVIVTNLSALKWKYGDAGVKSIQAAVKTLIAADKARGLETTFVALDDEAAMKRLKAPPVTNGQNPKQNKRAIDGVYKALAPDYMMILGAVDVVPHQDLKNPLYVDDPQGDDDVYAYSDLPYACDAPYSQEIMDFTGPTRVVGRLPDLTAAKGSPKYLLGLLKTAATWKSLKPEDYQSYFGVSAETWLESTAESLTKTFSSSKEMQTSPKQGYKWKKNLINRRAHFINCHGGKGYPSFFGQSVANEEDFPVSHMSSFVTAKGNILEGTVVAAECCYGAELYDPDNPNAAGQMGICNAYLDKKAYAFFGSTTTAYGPSKGNAQADLICQYFLQRVLAGASTGRAALEARQRFIEKASPLSEPTNRKTLAQFGLYGDPSVVPVDIPTAKFVAGAKFASLTTGVQSAKGKKAAAARAIRAAQVAGAAERAERRLTLHAKGALLRQLQPEVHRREKACPASVKAQMTKFMTKLNVTPVHSLSFDVSAQPMQAPPAKVTAKGLKKAPGDGGVGAVAIHVMVGRKTVSASDGDGAAASGAKKGGGRSESKQIVRRLVVLEAKEVGGKIVSISEAHSK